MIQLFQNILTASFHGSIVILVVILLRLVLKKTPKKFICLLWLLAGLRLLMPFEIKSDFSLQPEPQPIVQQILEPEEIVLPSQYYTSDHLPLETVPVNAFLPEAESATPIATEVLSPVETVEVYEVKPTIDLQAMLPWIWLTVASFFLVYTFYSYIHLKLMVREAIRIEGGWECENIETAFILGFIKPKIYIPMGLSKMVRKHILAHERTHLEKGDHWFKMIGFIALALHWFNPLVWVAYILLCKDIELACDERVVQFMELQERKEYSAALLNCSTNKAHFAACPVAFGEVSVKHRIKSVLKYKKPSFWISLLGVIAIAFVAVCLVTSPVEKESAAPKEETVGDAAYVTVKTVDEFLDAIAPNTVIYLEAGTYQLNEASNYAQRTGSAYYDWNEMGDGHELVIKGVDNLTIRGSGKVSTTIATDPRYANVLRLENCTNLVLDDFTAGHTDGMGECSGGVISLNGCQQANLDSLGLYGCGTVGLCTDLCSDVFLTNSDIYDCSSAAVVSYTSKCITVSNCRIYDIGDDQYGGCAFFELTNTSGFIAEKCELSTSNLNNILYASNSDAELRNNLFVGNRIKQCAFSLTGPGLVLDDNKFDGNTIRSWYDGYGQTAQDSLAQPLTESMLNEMYPSGAKEPTQPQLEIHVSTVDELIAAIGPNKDIVLDGKLYDFSTATGYGTSSGDYFYWEDVYDGPGLVIRNVDNMTIRSNDGNVKNHTIAAIPRYADVLAFSACSNVTLSGFTAGHTKEPGSCAGGVIEFRDCDNMTVDNCGLYGCGILGVYAEFSKNITVTNSDIYECSLGGIQMRNTENITISGNTFRDLGGDATNFIGCSNVNMDGQLLNPKAEQQPQYTPDTTEPANWDNEDIVNLGHTVSAFARALFSGDEATMRLHLAKNYEYYDIPLEIPEEVQGATLSANQQMPVNYANEMETKGYCTVTANYVLPIENDEIHTNMMLEMCRENGIWKVQYYALDDTEVELIDKDIYNFTWAYFEQDLKGLKQFMPDDFAGSIETYLGNAGDIRPDPDFSVGSSYSNAELAQFNYHIVDFPFKETANSDTWSYLQITLQRRENKKTYTEGGLIRTESEWVVTEYHVKEEDPGAANTMYLPGGIQIDTIERENYSGTVMLIEDPSRVVLGTSTDSAFSTDTPGKRINEMFDRYPNALAAVNAGAFFDDGTASAAVGSYPLGLTISNGAALSSPAQDIHPGMAGFAGFNTDNELLVFNRNLTVEEAESLEIRDGVGMGPALIIDREVQTKAEETNSGYTARTAIGQREDGTVILMCINGRVWDSIGASYADVINEMMTYGAANACLMNGGSSTSMMYRANTTNVPQLLTSIMVDGKELTPRPQPTYWMVAAK